MSLKSAERGTEEINFIITLPNFLFSIEVKMGGDNQYYDRIGMDFRNEDPKYFIPKRK